MRKIYHFFRVFILVILTATGLQLQAADYYWVGGEGFWYEYQTHWATSSGGSVFHTAVPGPTDNVFFDANSFAGYPLNQRVKLEGFVAICNNMSWAGATNYPKIVGSQSLYIHGSLTFIPEMVVDYGAPTYFKASNKTVTICTAGNSMPVAVYFDGQNGHWQLCDDLNVAGNIYLNWGQLTTNNYNITCYRFGSKPLDLTNVRQFNMGNSLITIGLADDNVNSIYSCEVNNDLGTLHITSGGSSLIRFLGSLGNLSTMYAGLNLTYDDVQFYGPGHLISDSVTFNDVYFYNHGTMHVETSVFDTVEIYRQGLAYSNNSDYYRFRFSTHPAGCWCGDCRNVDYGLLQGNNNQVTKGIDFHRNGTIRGNNNTADSLWFFANGYILTGENEFNKVLMQRHWPYGCTCPGWLMDTLTLEKNKTQTINLGITLWGDYRCLHTRITTSDVVAAQPATVMTNVPMTLDYVSLKGIIALSGQAVCDTAKRSVDLGGNQNWCFINNYIPIEDTAVIVTDVHPCHDDANGTVTIHVRGGQPPYKYFIYTGSGGCYGGYSANDPPTSNVFTGLRKGLYHFKVIDSYECADLIIDTIVGGPMPVVIDSVKNFPIPCYNDPPNTNGKIIIHAGGGTGIYQYWMEGRAWQDSSVFENVSLGEHRIQVRDDSLCYSHIDTIMMTQRPEQFMVINIPDIVACWGDTARIRIRTWGGTPPYQLEIFPLPPSDTVHGQAVINALIPAPNPTSWMEFWVHAGNYRITITDANGCMITDNRQVFENPKIEYTYTKRTVTEGTTTTYCLKVIPEGGIPPYHHHWSNGSVLDSACNLVPGWWYDTITDNLGCKQIAAILIEPLGIDTLQPDTVCFNVCNGSSCVNAFGGSTPYNFTWSNGSHQPCLINVCPGLYHVTVTDASGGIVIDSVRIYENPQILATFLIDTVSCGGGNDGQLTVFPSGGSPYLTPPEYRYQWSNGSLTNVATGLIAGTYTVTVSDSKHCSASFSIDMPQPTPLEMSFVTGSTDLCATYQATTHVSGGSQPYSYLWSNGQTTNPAIGLSPGTYTVTVTDVEGCRKISSVTITALAAATSQTNVTCYGACNGTATATVTGGNRPYTITWKNSLDQTIIASTTPVSAVIDSLCPGTYTVTVVDSNNCTVTRSVTISQPVYPLEVVTLNHTNMLDCHGDCDGTATIYASGGTAPYRYRWEKAITPGYAIGTGQSISGLCAGNYCVTVTDANNCPVDSCFTIDQPEAILFTYESVSIPCWTNGDAGSITFTNVTGGTPPYRYSINCPTGNYVTTSAFSNLPPATYSIGVMDSRDCKSACINVTITRPNAISIAFSPVNHPTGNGLNNGSITSTATGGVAPFTHYWLDQAGTLLKQEVSVTSTLSALYAGTYCDSIVDANNCVNKKCTTLVEPAALIITVDSSNISCFGKQDGWITISIAGGVQPYVIQWAAPCVLGCTNATISNLAAGYYSVQVTDANNNQRNRVVHIIEPLPILVNFNSPVVCHGATNGWIKATASRGTPPFTHHWSNGMRTDSIFGLQPGRWYVDTVTDIRGCQALDSLFLEENPPLFVTINNTDPTVCKGEGLSINAVAYGGIYPYTFSWSPTAGVSDPTILEPVITPLSSETYIVTMTDLKGCTSADTITIGVDSLPVAGFTYSNVCQSFTVDFTSTSFGNGTGIDGYLWDFGDGYLSVEQNPHHTYNSPGTYNVSLTVTNYSGCADYMMSNVYVNPVIQVEFASDTVCLGSMTHFTGYSLNPATFIDYGKWYFDDMETITVDPWVPSMEYEFGYSGLHSVKLELYDTTGCFDQITKPVLVKSSPQVGFTFTWGCTSDTVKFFGESSGAGGAANWRWTFGDPASGAANHAYVQNPVHVYNSAGLYTVDLTVTGANGCESSASQQFFYDQSPHAGFTFNSACFGSTTHFTDQSYATTGNLIMWQWNFGDPLSGLMNTSTIQNPSHDFTAPGTYQVKLKVFEEDLCYDSLIRTVVIHQPPYANFLADERCVGQMTIFRDLSLEGDTAIRKWSWDFGDTETLTYTVFQPTVMHPYTISGTYTVTLTVEDRNGCTHSLTRLISVAPLPTAMFQISPACAGQLTYFTDFSNGSGSSIIAWNWNFGDPGSGSNFSALQHPTHIYSTTGLYNVTLCVQNADSCINCYTQAVAIHPSPVASFSADTACVGTPTFFDNLSWCLGDVITSWVWNFGDNTPSSNMQWPVHVFTAAGTYQVSLIVTTQNGCSADTVIPVVVHENPVANFSWFSPSGTSCYHTGDSTHFTDLSTITGGNYLNHWQWDFGDGHYSNEQHPVHRFDGPGTYYVTLTVMDIHGCQHALIKPVVLSSGPMASYEYSIHGCDSAWFENHSIGLQLPVVSYLWNFDDAPSGVNNFSAEENPMHVFYTPVTHTYNVRLIVTDSLGCSDTIFRPVTISKPVADFATENSCIGVAAQFTDLSVSDSNFIASWSWNFGDAGSSSNMSNLQNPIHVYSAVGTYYVTLTVTNGHGCTATTGKTIYISYPPDANWSYDEPNCYPDSTRFSDLSLPQGSVPITSWLWVFGDGDSSTLKNPVHRFANPGTYVVTLSVENADGCRDEFSREFHYFPGPTAAFTHEPVSKCRLSVVTFSDQSTAVYGNVVGRSWDFGDGSPASPLEQPTHIYQNAGTYDVRLIVFDQRGCSDTVSQTITIHDLPLPVFTADTTCLGSATQFYNLTAGNGLVWEWDFGEPSSPTNTSSAFEPQHTFATAGVFFVRLRATDGNSCQKDTLIPVVVVPVPLVNFSHSSPCSGQPVNFTDQTIIYQGGITDWIWHFGDGTGYHHGQNQSHIFASPGIYNVTLEVISTGNCPPESVTRQVTVLPGPVAGFTHSAACEGANVQFTDQTNMNGGTNVVSWNWNFDDPLSGPANTSVVQHPAHLFSQNGIFNVTLVVENADGCRDTLIRAVVVNPKPAVEFAYGQACAMDTLCFSVDTNITQIRAITGYRWDLNGDGLIDSYQQNPCYFYPVGGLVNVTLTVTDTNGCENSRTRTVDIFAKPIANFNVPAPVCTGNAVSFDDNSTAVSGHITTWIWEFGDGSDPDTIHFPANPDIQHIFPGFGPYLATLRVFSSVGCEDVTTRLVSPVASPTANFSHSAPCDKRQVQFTDLSTTNSGVNLAGWQWDFGDPVSGINNLSSLQNPIHTFTAPGTYFVTLLVRNLNNCTDTIIRMLVVNERPVANFTADTVCALQPMSFTDLSLPNAPDIISHFWEFGDGSTSTLVNPAHIYATHGIYTVKLTVTNSNGCSRDTTKPVLVRPLAIPHFTFPGNHCLNSEICFTDQSTTPAGYLGYIVQWRWDFGDGSPVETVNYPSNPNVCHTFAGNALSHSVTLTVMTSDSCVSSVTYTIVSTPYPVANFDYSTVTCMNQEVQFTDLTQMNGGTAIAYRQWTFGEPTSGSNNVSTLMNPVHSYSAPGTYTVRLISTNINLCSDTVEKTVYINEAPVADFSASNVCQGRETVFTNLAVANAASIQSYLWNFGDNTISSDPNPSHTYNSYGTFNVTLTIVNSNGCIHDTMKVVTVYAKPVAAFTHASPACDSTLVQFTDQSAVQAGTGGQITGWRWNFGDGSPLVSVTFPGSPNVGHLFPGGVFSFPVELMAETDHGCRDSVTQTVQLFPNPVAAFEVLPGTATCAGQEVAFHDLSQQNGGGVINTWSWDFGDPGSGVNNTSVAQHPVHIFQSGNATYPVRLIITNLNGCRDTISIPVFIRPAPPVAFNYDQTCVGKLVTFTADQSLMNPAGIATWDWDFGDGSIHASNPGSASHTYNFTGSYQVVLTVTDTNGCISSLAKTIFVVPSPVASFSFLSAACDSNRVQFTDLSVVPAGFPGYINRWIWEWGDGTSDTVHHPASPNLSHLFPAGVYSFNVKLTVRSNSGCEDFIIKTVNLSPRPIAAFEPEPGSPACATQPVQFHDLSQTNGGGSITGWLWNFGDPGSGASNTSSFPNPMHIYSNSGTYNVVLTVTNANGCSDRDTLAVVIEPQPLADFSADTACAGLTTHFTDLSGSAGSPIVSWSWDFGDGGTSSLSSPVHSYTVHGVYQVTLSIVNMNGCIRTITKPVLVAPTPVAAFTWSETSCVGSPVVFTDQSFIPSGFSGYIRTWIWDFGDGTDTVINHPASPDISHTFLGNANSHIVSLTVVTTAGCTDSVHRTVNSIPSPIANFGHSSATCFGQPVQFNDLSQTNGGGSIQSWSWNFGDPVSGANNVSTLTNPIHSFTGAGLFTVVLTVTNTNGCSHSKDTVINVNPLPEANFSYQTNCEGKPVIFTDLSAANAGATGQIIAYDWNFGDGTTSIQPEPQHVYPAFGTYTVTLTVTNSNGCLHTITKPVEVIPDPIAEFTFSPSSCIGSAVSFYNQSYIPAGFSSYIHQWVWDFGDGSAPVVFNYPANPDTSHLFLGNSSSHVVKLIVTTTAGCVDSVMKTVVSNLSPKANFAYSSANCINQPVQFTDLTQPNGGGSIQSWSWNFGDPLSGANNTSTLKNPVHSFSGTGLFTVSLVVTNISGCSHSHDTVLMINPLPEADFSFTVSCEGSPTFFSDSSVANAGPAGQINSYSWNFGDGGTSTLPSPQHTFTSFGTYTVTLTVVNSNNCLHSTTRQVTVNPRPVAGFTHSPSGCVGKPVSFYNQSYVPAGYSAIIQRWIWDFGDGTPRDTIIYPGDPNVSHVFAGSATAHVVRLIVTTSTGCTDSISRTVVSEQAPVANFSYSAVTCVSQSTHFSDLTQANGGGLIQNWNWNFGDPLSGANNTSTLQNPTHSFSHTGPFTVTLTATNISGCASTIDTVIIINPLPVANFTNSISCEGAPTLFHDTSQANAGPLGTIIAYSWNFGDGGTSILQHPEYTFASYGNNTVTLTVENSNGCYHTVSKPVLVNPKPVAEFTHSAAGCVGLPMNFISQSYVPSGYASFIQTWEWDFGDGSTTLPINYPFSPNIAHTFLGTATMHQVSLTVTTNKGCVGTKEKTVSSAVSPMANFSFSEANCVNQAVQFNDLTQLNGGGSIQTWSWNFGDPLSGGGNVSTVQNPTHTFSGTGDFTVTLVVTNLNGCTHTHDTVISIDPQPVANFTYADTCAGIPTMFTSTSQANAMSIISYAWNFGDGGTSVQMNPAHAFSAAGTYQVTLTIVNSNYCSHTVTKAVTVDPKALAEFAYSPSACMESPVSFYDQSSMPSGSGSTISTWVWNYGDGSPNDTIHFPGNPNRTHTFLGTATSHVVRLTVITSKGCESFKEKTVNSIPKPDASFSFGTTSCANTPLQFNDLSQTNGGGSIMAWAWNFGDPLSGANNFSTVQNPAHQFTSASGSPFQVTLIVTNSNGCRDTVVNPVSVNTRPVADFTADPVCQGSNTIFTDISNPVAGSITYRLWDFGDGTTSSSASPTIPHLFASAGYYNVKLTVTNTAGCVKDTIKAILVYGKPVASFSYGSPACAGDSVQFSDLSTAPHGYITDWVWNFGDGTPPVPISFPQNQNIKHRYANGGNYPVTLTITTSDGCVTNKTTTVQIGHKPVANFTWASIACPGQALQFTDLSQLNGGPVITNWNWDFGDPVTGVNNTATTQHPAHAFSHADTYTVRLKVTNAIGCWDTLPGGKTVTINAAPVASFTAENFCFGSPTQFTDGSSTTSGTIQTWLWNFDDPQSGTNNTSQLPDPNHQFSNIGTYDVSLIVTNSHQCQKDTVIQVTIGPKPTAMFQYSGQCEDSEIHFTDLSIAPGSSIIARTWDFGDGTILPGNDPTPEHVYQNPGTYQTKLVVENFAGCLDSITLPVVVRPSPVASFNYSNFYCPAGKVNFTSTAQGVGGAAITTYQWIFESGGSPISGTIPTQTFTYTALNQYHHVTHIVSDNYTCRDTIVDSVFVKPGWGFTFEYDTVCFGTPTGFRPVNLAPGDSLWPVSWNFGDPTSFPNNTSGLYNPYHTFTQPGLYPVKFKAQNSDRCVDSIYLYVKVNAGPQPLFSYHAAQCDSVLWFTDSTFNKGDGFIKQWIWVWGDGQSDTIAYPGPGHTSHTYSSPGKYQVTLKLTNSNDCVGSVTRMVERIPCVLAGFAQSGLLCARNRIAFSDTSLPVNKITQWKWSWGDGKPDTIYTTFAPVVYHNFTSGGTYNVILEVKASMNGSVITDRVTGPVTIHPTPSPQFTNPPVCLGVPTLFADNSILYGAPVTKRKWLFGSSPGDTSILANPTHLYDTAGIYAVKLILQNGFGCRDSLVRPTRVYGLPSAGYSVISACSGDPALFTDKTIPADTTLGSWKWYFGDPSTWKDTSMLQNPSYKYQRTGEYDIRMIVKDHFGCADTIDSTLLVRQAPVAAFTITEDIGGTPGKIQLNNRSSITGGYDWKFPGATGYPEEENPIVQYSADGKHEITLIVTDEFDCSDSTIMEYEFWFDNLYVPNAFSPSSLVAGKGLEIREFIPKGRNLADYHIMVFDKWGHLLWESQKITDEADFNRPKEGWDGTYQGKEMPQDVYMWKINARFKSGKVWEGSDSGTGSISTMGTVTLIR